MQFSTLKSLIAEVRKLAPGRRIFLFGASSLLASFPKDSPSAIGVEMTLDADFFLEPDDEQMRDQLVAVLGRNRAYHRETGHYCDFVDLRMSEGFPTGWRERLVAVPGEDNVFAIHPIDAAVNKVIATSSSRLSRRLGGNTPDRGMKDINTIVALIRGDRLDFLILEARVTALDLSPALTVECGNVMSEIRSLAAKA
jgi:hypothetical protein